MASADVRDLVALLSDDSVLKPESKDAGGEMSRRAMKRVRRMFVIFTYIFSDYV